MSDLLRESLKRGMELHGARRLGEAEAVYRQVLATSPGHLLASHLLGVVELQTGRLGDARSHLEQAVSGGTSPFDYYPPLIDAAAAMGHVDQAVHWQRTALALRPRWSDGHARLGRWLAQLGQLDQAADAMRQAISTGPVHPENLYNDLGVILDRAGQYGHAELAYQSALAIKPDYAIAHRNLGDALRLQGKLESAEASYRSAAKYDPAMADARNGIGLTLYLRNRFNEAVEQYQIAMKLNPADVNPRINLVLCYGRLGDLESLETAIRQAGEISPDDATIGSALAMVINYTRGHELPAVLEASREFARRFEPPLNAPSRPVPAPKQSVRKLRIGYISPDFRRHPVAIFFEPLLKQHDRNRFTIACYSNADKPDEVTGRIKSQADLWRDIVGQSDDEVAGQIQTDEIDILIDLAGHTVDNRLLVLARKPAPIQMTWMGYPNTTGLTAIDYRITDLLADPLGVEPYYTEKLIRLPGAFFVYEPPTETVPVGPLPMQHNGFVTFGSFNNITKITRAMCRVWAEILQAIPTSKLLLAGIPPDGQPRLLSMFTGVNADRLEFPQTITFEQFLSLHHQVDIALDSFPYTGHTTSCNCLWMGVPLVSLAGTTAVSRCGVSILGNLSLAEEWLVTSEADYVKIAVNWATRADDLAELRAGLRERLETSVLADAQRFARVFEDALLALGR